MKPKTYKVYVRWPGQRVSDKTTTESQDVAEFAYRQIIENASKYDGADGAAITFNQKGVDYMTFEAKFLICENCGFNGAFLQNDICPECLK